ncbi:MAG TPA: 1-acyl-sn-glycerol-3-phosphate acyltransferase [Bacteroidaceae bacterium]|nr:1-acyl-sn-glycerol-3-phosphate acyltransferase [Bacteroidaceae bacterium]
MGRKIQDGHFKYFFIKYIVDFFLRNSYRRFQVEGLENLPDKSSVIWASNHTNALMDALVLLASTKSQKVFLGRADIFNKRLVIRLLAFIKMMPIYRIRDGFNSLKRNEEVISKAIDVLKDCVPLLIFPEATHRTKHSLLPITKGVFHITYAVAEINGSKKPVYIQPIGIDYGDFFRYRSTALIRFGKPIDVTKFIVENKGISQPVQMRQFREILSRSLSELISFVPDDNDYDSIWEYAKLRTGNKAYFKKVLVKQERACGCRLNGLMRIQAVNRYAINQALTLREQSPEVAAEQFQKIDKLRLWRIQNGVSVYSIAKKNAGLSAFFNFFPLIIGLPYFIFSIIVSILIWLTAQLILSNIKDEAFNNSVRICVRLVMSPISVLLWGVIFFISMPLYMAIVATILLFPACSYYYDYKEFFRRWMSDIRWTLRKKKAPKL